MAKSLWGFDSQKLREDFLAKGELESLYPHGVFYSHVCFEKIEGKFEQQRDVCSRMVLPDSRGVSFQATSRIQ